MTTKKYFILLVFSLSTFFIKAQSSTETKSFNPSQNQSGKKYSSGQTQNMVQSLKHDTCLNKKFSIVFYLIQDSAFTLTTSPTNTTYITYSLSAIMSTLNAAFAPICVSFEHCKTVIIPNYEFNRWRAYTNGAHVIANWFTENTICIYLPKEILDVRPDDPEYSYAYGPPTHTLTLTTMTIAPGNAIVIEKTNALDRNRLNLRGPNILHAMGHFFGLEHTFFEKAPTTNMASAIPLPPTNATPIITTHEFAERSNYQNCYEHGDGFCDTEADPFPSTSNVNPAQPFVGGCSDNSGLKDGKGDFYLPPIDNIMSVYQCRCRFSQEQYNYMAYVIQTQRLYLH